MTALRTRYSDVGSLVAFIEEHGGPPCDPRRWQPWVLDHAQAQLRHRDLGCCVDLTDCLTPRGALLQVQTVARSTWAAERDVAGLLAALYDLLLTPYVEVPADDLASTIQRAMDRSADPRRTAR